MALIFMITPNAASVDADQVLPLTTIARRLGRIITSGNDGVLLNLPGYYRVTASVTTTTTGNIEIKLQKNSVDVPGIIATSSDAGTITLSGIVRSFPNDSIATLTLLNSGVAIDTTNISLEVEYIC